MSGSLRDIAWMLAFTSAICVFGAETAAQWFAVTTPTRPPTLFGHVQSYDVARAEVMVYGGKTPLPNRSGWVYDGRDWVLRYQGAIGGVGPGFRWGASIAYDERRQRTVMFGGTATTQTSDLWEWDGFQWQAVVLTPQPRPSQFGTLMAYDSRRGLTVLLEGSNRSTGAPATTWEYDGQRWVVVPTTSVPPFVDQGSLVYDSRRGVCVLWGEHFALGVNRIWEYDGLDWRSIQTPSAPSPRVGPAMTFHEALGVTVLHGGRDDFSGATETWIYDGFDWVQVQSAGQLNRHSHSLSYCRHTGTIVCFGGLRSIEPSQNDETWELILVIPQSYTHYSVSCGRPGFQPSLDLQSPFQIATNFAVDITGIPFGTPQAWMLVGLATPPTPVDLQSIGMVGCQLAVDPIATLVLPAFAGRATWTGAVPSGPEWVGQGIFHQAMVIDRLANPFGVVTTGAARAVVGN